MGQKLTSTQAELLQLLPATLSNKEMEQLQLLLKAFFAQTEKGQAGPDLVAEPTINYTARESESIILTIPRNWLDDVLLAKIQNWLEMKQLTERNQMTEAQALEMGELAKADWWAKNQQWVLAKIGEQS